ncbi:Uncharacterised protein [Mycobacteroides abscessus subsp. abscessus]|uniref:hypothetical protein n=1 Tax=Mycobacteroides abscessus TaxID=36809 RepID=UPI000929B0DE|nr:hypothetical protein [Mycobacteroides abscessus]SIM26599.1 Uncharacterised protein [Mycobacteroides abscessus subsp. abscessus]SLC78538.1 Uncharacterised protein [Mycobacteroides abscessus subsp. abscessus]
MIQLIEYWTDRFAEVDALLDEWISSTQGGRTAVRTRIGVDRHDPFHHIEIIEFRSAADADRNSALPGTDEVHRRFVPLCTRGPIFTDLLICRDTEL